MQIQDSMLQLIATVAEVAAPILQALAATTLLEHHHQQPLHLQLNLENQSLIFLLSYQILRMIQPSQE